MTETELSNKCDICGLKQQCPDDVDNLFQKINLLYSREIIPRKYPKKLCGEIKFGDGINEETWITEFCLISHPSWSHDEERCDAWQLAIKDLRKGDFLAINLASASATSAKETERLTAEIKDMTLEIRDMTKRMKLFTKVIIVCTVIQIIISTTALLITLTQ